MLLFIEEEKPLNWHLDTTVQELRRDFHVEVLSSQKWLHIRLFQSMGTER